LDKWDISPGFFNFTVKLTDETCFNDLQVDWAGDSSTELLVEWLSRFRDKREFLLVNVVTGHTSVIWSETDPAWVVASVAKNSVPNSVIEPVPRQLRDKAFMDYF
jgi:hypothetical protein